MLNVISLEDARNILLDTFGPFQFGEERVLLEEATGRVLARPVFVSEWVPGFTRSSMDGYALRAADTFGCGEALPAQLTLIGEVYMGKDPDFTVQSGQCAYIPTGGKLPPGADAVVMVEHTEDYRDGTVGILSPCAPGAHLIFRGDDVTPGQQLLPAGHRLRSKDIGALAAIGVVHVAVRRRPTAAVISTGDELVPPEQTPQGGQVRDVNGPMLVSSLEEFNCKVETFDIVSDDPALLRRTVAQAVRDCDLVLLSGGSSVGSRDASRQVLEELGHVLFHGIAVKPGKPTLLGDVNGVPVFGLPGHPVAAWFLFRLLVAELLQVWTGRTPEDRTVHLPLAQAVPSNHGREEYVLVRISEGHAVPLGSKSGLITALTRADGYLQVPRDTEGLSAGTAVPISLL